MHEKLKKHSFSLTLDWGGEKSKQVVKQLVKHSVFLKDVIFDNW